MFFEEVKLSRNSWHYKLQKWLFGEIHFTNFCPYFWLTILSLFIAPVVGFFAAWRWLWNKFWSGTGFVGEVVLNLIDSWVCKPVYQVSLNRMSEEDVYDLFRHSQWKDLPDSVRARDYEARQRYVSNAENTLKDLKDMRPDWMDKLDDIVTRMAKEREEKERQRKLDEARSEELYAKRKHELYLKKQKILRAVKAVEKVFKYLFIGLLAILSVVVAWVLYKFLCGVVYVAGIIPWLTVFKVLLYGVAIILSLAVVLLFLIGIFKGLVWVLRKCNFRIFRPLLIPLALATRGFRKTLGPLFNVAGGAVVVSVVGTGVMVGSGACAAGESIAGTFSIFIQFAKTFKNNNCPKISWED